MILNSESDKLQSLQELISLCSNIIDRIAVFEPLESPPIEYSSFVLPSTDKNYSLPIKNYLLKIATVLDLDKETMILSMMLLDRLLKMNSLFKLNDLTMHKTIFMCIMETVKFNDDNGFTNSSFALAGGYEPSELLQMEIDFLGLIEYNLNFGEKDFYSYQDRMNKLWISWRVIINKL